MSLRKPLVPYTDYKEPSDASAQIALPSSIVSGNTADGGLRSITYKAVYAALLVEELDMARRAVILGEPQITQVSDSKFVSEDKVIQLRNEVASFKGEESLKKDATDEISALNSQLETEIKGGKTVRTETAKNVRGFQKEFRKLNLKYVITKVSLTKARKLEDVPGFDADIYLRAAERRREEQQQQQQQKFEKEQLLVEQPKQSENAIPETQPETTIRTVEQTEAAIPEQLQDQSQQQSQEQIPALGLVEEPALHLPEPTLDDLSYAIDSETLMVPGFTENYVPSLHEGEQIASIPQFEGAYLPGPGPQ